MLANIKYIFYISLSPQRYVILHCIVITVFNVCCYVHLSLHLRRFLQNGPLRAETRRTFDCNVD